MVKTVKIDFSKAKHVHFIGIGGIGISAIARMMLLEGKKVTGSDTSASLITEELEKMGARIFIGHQTKEQITQDIDVVIYTIAVPTDSPDLVEAHKLNIPVLTYPEALTIISEKKYTIAVSGTHGKTTTTAMIAKLLIDQKFDPTVIVGSFLKNEKSNFISGKSKYFVVEACEYRRSFLHLEPKIVVITNIDNDHLDYYKNMKDIQSAFSELVAKLGKKDFLICDGSSPTLQPIIKNANCIVVDYRQFQNDKLKLKVPGKHNTENAAAVLAVAHVLGIEKRNAEKSLSTFPGTWRRFEFKGKTAQGVFVYDDYGHHPTEIRATLSGARELFPKKNIVVVFQPHLYSRTKDHLHEFGKCFTDADAVIVPPIYAAREVDDGTISSEMLVKEIEKNGKKAFFAKDFNEAIVLVSKMVKTGDIVMTIGAGDVYLIGDELIK